MAVRYSDEGGRMAGPAPKPKDERRRRNEPARGEWVDLAPLSEPVIPELVGEFSDRVRAMWLAWRTDPVTAQWTLADLDYALDTIELREREWPRRADEIRRRMDALGLTPKGKRDLRWRIAGEIEEVAPRRAAQGSSSRRARLSVVK